jgi:hypothetical protein
MRYKGVIGVDDVGVFGHVGEVGGVVAVEPEVGDVRQYRTFGIDVSPTLAGHSAGVAFRGEEFSHGRATRPRLCAVRPEGTGGRGD